MRALLATVLILGGMLLLVACTKEEEANEDPTATAKPSVTATATAAKTATATPAGAATSATPGRDFVRRPTLPTRTPTAAPPPVQTAVAQPPVVQTAAPPPPVVQTAAPQPTPVPPVQTATPQQPYWETWVPFDPVTPGTMVELSIHNANGAPGETYSVAMRVLLPDQTDVVQEGVVSGSDWLTFYFGDTMLPGFYDVYFGLPQSDLIYAEDYFEVADTSLYEPAWQTSAPRTAVAAGDVVEVGLRNENGSPGECYDFMVEVYDPDGYYASGSDTVCGADWTFLTYSDTWTWGYYDVSYYIGDQYVASDYFQVGY
jgi:hypothetical protein